MSPPLCWPCTGQMSINIQHDLIKIPGSNCQQLTFFILKEHQHQEVLAWEGYWVTYPNPIAFREDKMHRTPTLADVHLSSLFPKPLVQEINNYSVSLSQHYNSLASKNPTHTPSTSV